MKFRGSAIKFWGLHRKFGGFHRKSVGLPSKSGGLQRKYWVSNENMGISNENMGVSNKKGVFNSTLEKAKHHLSFVILFNKLNNMRILAVLSYSVNCNGCTVVS